MGLAAVQKGVRCDAIVVVMQKCVGCDEKISFRFNTSVSKLCFFQILTHVCRYHSISTLIFKTSETPCAAELTHQKRKDVDGWEIKVWVAVNGSVCFCVFMIGSILSRETEQPLQVAKVGQFLQATQVHCPTKQLSFLPAQWDKRLCHCHWRRRVKRRVSRWNWEVLPKNGLCQASFSRKLRTKILGGRIGSRSQVC